MTASYATHFVRLARYNMWANSRVRDAVSRLSKEQAKADTGLVFRSILGTINHMALADELWHARLTTGKPTGKEGLWVGSAAGWEKAIPDLDDAIERLLRQSATWESYVCELAKSPDQFDQQFSYMSTSGKEHEATIGPILDHVFNHGTHHRGQISAALTSLGEPAPVLDLLYYIVPKG